MKLVLTTRGISDNTVRSIPLVDGFIPRQPHVSICVCWDPKQTSLADRTGFDQVYYERLFKKLCQVQTQRVVKTVSVEYISFFHDSDADFYAKLRRCDLFFFAGFAPGSIRHIQNIFRRDDEGMTLRRMAVANYVTTNLMALWAVCGSAVACGMTWSVADGRASGRMWSENGYQMLGMLADGEVRYDKCSGPAEMTFTDDLRDFHISTGTGMIIVTDAQRQHGEAFVCDRNKENYRAYQVQADIITQKMQAQLQRLYSLVTWYRSGRPDDSPLWCLCWGTGICNVEGPDVL
jgi:hypothetical protein